MDRKKIKKELSCRIAGAASGLLLAVPNLFPVLVPIHLIALIPVLYLGASQKNKLSTMFTAGIYMGLFYTIPQMIMLRMPIPVTLILLVQYISMMAILAFVSAWLIRKNVFWGAFAVGAFLVVLDWVNFTAVPLWGTAQSIVRAWSQYPGLIQFSSLTGMTGIIFVLGTLQALIVNAIINPQLRRQLLTTSIILILFFAIIDIIILDQQPAGKLKVAAIGWTSKELEFIQTPAGFKELFAKQAAKAADQGAKFIVSPEMGFYINKSNRCEWLDKFQAVSRKYDVFLAIGYFDILENQNRLIYITPDGKTLPEYSKTYLLPFVEDYKKGDGQLRVININGISVGGMICHDDNFTRFSREYGRERISVVAVPTLDWSTVRNIHLQNSIYRAIESRYAIIRAAMNGVSAIISPQGDVLASCDHFKKGPSVIVAEIPICKCRTLFSIAGHWPVVAGLVFLVAYIALSSSPKQSMNCSGTESTI